MKTVFFYLKPYFLQDAVGNDGEVYRHHHGAVSALAAFQLIDEIVPRKNMGENLFYGFLMLVCSVIGWVGNVTANRMASRVARNTTERLRHDLFAKISYLSAGRRMTLPLPPWNPALLRTPTTFTR